MHPISQSLKHLFRRRIKTLLLLAAVGLVVTVLVAVWKLELNPAARHFKGALASVVRLLEPETNSVPQTFVAKLKVVKSEGLPEDWAGMSFDLALQSPDRLRFSGAFKGMPFLAARDGQEIWLYAPAKQFGLVGNTNIALFSTAPEFKRATPLAPLQLPVTSRQLALLPLALDLNELPDETVNGVTCDVVTATSKPTAHELIRGLPRGMFQLWIRQSDSLPLRLGYREGKTEVQVELENPRWESAWQSGQWKIPTVADDRIELVACEHLLRFLKVMSSTLGEKNKPLGPATGERHVVARQGRGRLEVLDGTRVLFLKGTPGEMGEQHGKLLGPNVRSVVDHVLYGVGVGTSFPKRRWFFGEIESAQKRLLPYMDARYLREMDALASAARVHRDEMRLANFFPELFHCSGFALVGEATRDGHVYHGRILDYMKGVGLEPNAVVMVMQPEEGHAWVNVSYAGFVGSVTAMNDQRIAIGEMGGHGEGNWDGKPMAQLVREVMEKASSLDEAVSVMRESPRTCEYYYVISDGKTKQAVGIYATPEMFEVLRPGAAHPRINNPVKDAVLLSGGERLVELTKRVQAGWGTFDADSSRNLMTRPVCMKSNIHSVLFRPDTLDFWVANADGENVASHARYTHYNLAELLRPEKP